MALSWNEIRTRALRFSDEWAGTTSESGEAKSFWDALFHVYGVQRRRVAAFEHYVKSKGGNPGFIDLFWPGVLITEHKSRGKDLNRAYNQAMDYFPGIPDRDLPRYVIVSDFDKIRVQDLETSEDAEFSLFEFQDNVEKLGFIAGYEQRVFREQDPVNKEAAWKLAQLHDALHNAGYQGHRLEVYLVRILFCLFAEDTGIFMPRGAFYDFLEQCTREDGSDLGARLNELFDVLDTPETQRMSSRDERLLAFPHVNGALFEETLRTPAFDSRMRGLLMECCSLDWGQISPAIFGSLFQGIMDAEVRRRLGAHYTSEQNILKVIKPLFLDELREEFENLLGRRSTDRKSKLRAFQDKLSSLNWIDPAAGCGNFLVITYREIRQLELEVIQAIHEVDSQQLALNAVEHYVKVDVDQFHGIEIEEWPSQIARVAMWLIDHQMNIKVSKVFGDAFVRIPLVKSANIVQANALQIDWGDVLPPDRCDYVLGNPPFAGAKYMSREQRSDIKAVSYDMKGHGLLDYCTGWYFKAVEYLKTGRLQDRPIRSAFVSTNSITQGEQAGILWDWVLGQGVEIQFAHKTFQWNSEARGKAAVHCVIIGFGRGDFGQKKVIFEYETPKSEPTAVLAETINPYLADGPNVTLPNRSRPVCNVPPIRIGNKPIDGGQYLFTPEEKADFLSLEPGAEPYFRRWIGSREYINNIERWCLWLGNCPPAVMRKMPHVMARVEAVRDIRAKSDSAPTRKIAETPTRFHVENIPNEDYLVIPSVSSERRPYIPVGYIGPEVLPSNLVLVINEATPYHFGVISSLMHMAWMRAVSGKLKSDYRYSAKLVYNNFPWPLEPDAKKVQRIEKAARGIIEARKAHPDATLADLYDPLSMPPELLKAHRENDKAVDAAYGVQGFGTEAERTGFLFQLYLKVTSGSGQ